MGTDFVEPATGRQTGFISGKLPAAAAWTGSTKLTVKRLKISTSIHWCATLASSYAAISRGKQIPFTLVSGILTDEYLHGGTIGTTINHLVAGFVKEAAVELPRGLRINCISPTLLA